MSYWQKLRYKDAFTWYSHLFTNQVSVQTCPQNFCQMHFRSPLYRPVVEDCRSSLQHSDSAFLNASALYWITCVDLFPVLTIFSFNHLLMNYCCNYKKMYTNMSFKWNSVYCLLFMGGNNSLLIALDMLCWHLWIEHNLPQNLISVFSWG